MNAMWKIQITRKSYESAEYSLEWNIDSLKNVMLEIFQLDVNAASLHASLSLLSVNQ